MSTKCSTWRIYYVGRRFLTVGQDMTQPYMSAQQVCTTTWLRHILRHWLDLREARALTLLGQLGHMLSQQTRTAKLFRHCRSLQIGTPHWVIPANRSLRTHSKLIMCRILESPKTRITSLHSTAIPTGHYCIKGIETKCSVSFFLRLLGRGLY